MKNDTSFGTIETSNMLEVAYMLDLYHVITEVTIRRVYPEDVAQLIVTMQGCCIKSDHKNFLRSSEMGFRQVSDALYTVLQAVNKRLPVGRIPENQVGPQ